MADRLDILGEKIAKLVRETEERTGNKMPRETDSGIYAAPTEKELIIDRLNREMDFVEHGGMTTELAIGKWGANREQPVVNDLVYRPQEHTIEAQLNRLQDRVRRAEGGDKNLDGPVVPKTTQTPPGAGSPKPSPNDLDNNDGMFGNKVGVSVKPDSNNMYIITADNGEEYRYDPAKHTLTTRDGMIKTAGENGKFHLTTIPPHEAFTARSFTLQIFTIDEKDIQAKISELGKNQGAGKGNAAQPETGKKGEGYDDGYRSALADLLEKAKGSGKEDFIATLVAALLGQNAGEPKKDLGKDLPDKTKEEPVAAKEAKPASEKLSPEDRLLNAMAALVEDAKGKSPEHQKAIAEAAASIAGSVKSIKESRTQEAGKEKAADDPLAKFLEGVRKVERDPKYIGAQTMPVIIKEFVTAPKFTPGKAPTPGSQSPAK